MASNKRIYYHMQLKKYIYGGDQFCFNLYLALLPVTPKPKIQKL